ncbi:MAG: Asp-tRNA(Asn)/Glu-tRNA(Gln) amidotransferase subunit GatC [Pseudomonadota bacterium]
MNSQQTKQVAHLARLHIDDDAIPKFAQELAKVITFVEQIQQADTDGIEPMSDPYDRHQRLREDKVSEHPDRQQFSQIAPATEAGLYLVPKVIE